MTSHQQHLLSVLSDIISSLVKAVNGAFTVLLDNVAIEIQQERQRFANSLAEAKRLNDNQQSTVILEVSSDTFHVGTQTLGHTESMLSAIALFPNPDGDATFIDRDAEFFPLILHFLRTGCALMPLHRTSAFLREARYYNLHNHIQHSTTTFFLVGFSEVYTNLRRLAHLDTWRSWAPNTIRVSTFPWRINSQITMCMGNSVIYTYVVDLSSLRSRVFQTDSQQNWTAVEHKWVPYSYTNSLLPNVLAHNRKKLYAFDLLMQTTLKLCLTTKHRSILPKRPYSRYMPYAVGSTLCTGQDKAYIFYEDFAEMFLFQDESWKIMPPLPDAISLGAAVEYNGRLIVTGGRTPKFRPVSTMYQYNFDTDTWHIIGRLPRARYGHTCVVHKGFMFLVGGEIGIIDKYDLRTLQWQSINASETQNTYNATILPAT
jgi:hypothetical protein